MAAVCNEPKAYWEGSTLTASSRTTTGADRKSICLVMTSTLVLNAFFLRHLQALADAYQVTVCVGGGDGEPSPSIDSRVEVVVISIKRPVAPWADCRTLLWLWRLFRSRRFDAVHSITPKAGLLAMCAARLAGIPLRTHVFTGQVWATRTGLSRRLFRALDGVINRCATDVHADSSSQAGFLEQERVVEPGRIRVLASGSICGVDVGRFREERDVRDRVRAALSIPAGALVFIYLGRLNSEKGLRELAQSFRRLAAERDDVWLLLVGKDEESIETWYRQQMLDTEAEQRVRFIGLTPEPENYLSAADVLCLPSYREGFGTVIIEAASVAVPAIGTRIYGVTDAILEGVTGLLVPVRNADALYDAMRALACDSELRSRLGTAARVRAHRDFSADVVTAAWRSYYDSRFYLEQGHG